jgi:hypothetical protein
MLEPLTSWLGLSRPSTQRRLKDAFGVARRQRRATERNFSSAKRACGAVDAQILVDGRDKPGHDAALSKATSAIIPLIGDLANHLKCDHGR